MDSRFATICSQIPYDLVEVKPGIYPNEYTIKGIAPGTSGFALTIIPSDVYYLINPDPLSDAKEIRNIKVPVPSMEIANSIINDYSSALIACSPPSVMPALFAVPGDYTDVKVFAATFGDRIKRARECQTLWFQALVEIADDTWSKSRSPVSISDLERTACKMLGFERDWLQETPTELLQKCPFCQNTINSGAIKCLSCGEILDKKRYAELTTK